MQSASNPLSPIHNFFYYVQFFFLRTTKGLRPALKVKWWKLQSLVTNLPLHLTTGRQPLWWREKRSLGRGYPKVQWKPLQNNISYRFHQFQNTLFSIWKSTSQSEKLRIFFCEVNFVMLYFYHYFLYYIMYFSFFFFSL